MSRPVGVIETKPRKKRKYYKNKLVKKKKPSSSFVKYTSQRHRGDDLHVQIVQREPMSLDGFKRWNKKIRPKVKKVIFRAFPSIRVPPEDLSTEEGIGDVVLEDRQGAGLFELRMQSSSKNKHHVSYRQKAIVRIIETEEGLRSTVLECWKLKRYFFWRGD